MNHWGIAIIGGSVLSLITGGLSYFILHGKVKSTKVKSRFLISIKCCFQKLDELEMALTQQFKLDYNNNFKFAYDNIDDPTIPFVERIRRENPNLPRNIINTFIELNYIRKTPDPEKLEVLEKEIVATYFRENCPKIKAKEYVEYFNNFTKESQISGNNLRTKEKGVRNKKMY